MVPGPLLQNYNLLGYETTGGAGYVLL